MEEQQNSLTIEAKLISYINKKVIDYSEAKQFKELFNSYCSQNKVNRLSVKWLRSFCSQKVNGINFRRRLNLLLRANNLTIIKDTINFNYRRVRSRERVIRTEQRFYRIPYIINTCNEVKI